MIYQVLERLHPRPESPETRRYYAVANIAGNIRRIKLTVRVYKKGSAKRYAYEVAKIETLGGSLRNQLTPLPQAAQPNVTKPATNPSPPALARRRQKAPPTSIQNYQILIAKGNARLFYHRLRLWVFLSNP